MPRRDRSPHPIVAVLEAVSPGLSCRERVKLFGTDRVKWHHIRDWIAGKAWPPAWAIDSLKTHLANQQAALEAAPISNGTPPNIIHWHKKRAAEKAALNAKREAGND